jgi:hypothetical protein
VGHRKTPCCGNADAVGELRPDLRRREHFPPDLLVRRHGTRVRDAKSSLLLPLRPEQAAFPAGGRRFPRFLYPGRTLCTDPGRFHPRLTHEHHNLLKY